MADITQTLGFTVTDALTALGQLDKKLEDLEKRLDTAAKAVQNFNQAGAGGLGGGKGVASNLADYITKLQELYSVSATAGVHQQRSFQSAITSAAEFAHKHGISVQQVVEQSANLGKSYTGTANVLADRLAAIDRASKEHLNAAGNRINGLAVTWQTMVRVVTTQLIVRAMSMLRNALEGAVTAAINFETRLAEIQTIGGPAAGSLKALAVQMKGLSEEFAKPLEDVTEGYYMILSNQVGNAAESFMVARESAKLSTAAVSSFADAANALSSVIQSYRMHASDANDISGKLFATVEMGRLRLSDIANTLGRVTVLGHEVGVSLDEVLASIATLTISGLKPDESMTLLSNAMRGLLKPTKDMKRAFDELGVANAEVGVATYGFQGFLEKLRGTTNGTATEIAKLTQNIRVGRGVIGLTGEAVQTYEKNLETIRSAGGETANAKAQLILETNAQQVQREFVALRNFFVNDFGVAALKVIRDWLETFGGLVNIIKSLKTSFLIVGTTFAVWKTFTLILAGVTLALNVQKAAALGAMAAMRALAAATVSIPGVAAIMLIVAGIIAWSNAGKSASASMADLKQKSEEALNAAIEQNNKMAEAATIDAKKVQSAREKVVTTAIAKQLELTTELQKLYNRDKENALEAQADILDNLKSQMRDRLALIRKAISELERKYDESQRVIDKNREETAGLRLQDQERYVDRQIGRLGEEQKAVLQLKRARELESQAARLSRTSDFKGSEELLKTADQRAMAALEAGEARLKEAKTVDEQQTALRAIAEAEDEVSRILRQRLTLREEENRVAAAQAEAARRESDARRAQLRDAKALVKEIEGYQAVGKKAGATDKEQQEARAKAMSAVSRLEDVLSRGDVTLEQFLGVQRLTQEIRGSFQSAITDRPVGLSVAFKEGIETIVAPLEAHKLRFKAVIEQLETTTGAKFDLESGYTTIQVKVREQGEELKKAINDVTQLETKKAALQNDQLTLIAKAREGFRDKNLTEQAMAALVQVRAATDQAIRGDSERLQGLIADFAKAQSDLTARADATVDNTAKKSLRDTAGLMAQMLVASKSLLQTREDIELLRATEPEAMAAIGKAAAAGDMAAQALQLLKVQQGQKVVYEYGKNLVQQFNELPVSAEAASPRVVSQLDAIGVSAGRAAEKVGVLSGLLSRMQEGSAAAGEYWFGAGEPAQAKAAGGLVSRMKFFESGGAARGTDSIPAMLSAGEFVTSARNARRFLPQLQAINAGIPPTSEPSSVVYNTTVGDINVNGAQQPKMVAREVMAAIRREQRRGSGRL